MIKSQIDYEILPDTYIGKLLSSPAPKKRLSNQEAAALIQETADRVEKERPNGDDRRIAELMAAEAIRAISGNGSSSLNWYTDSIDNALSVAGLIHPELVDEECVVSPFKSASEARVVFFAALSITSQNIKVFENVRYALEQYEQFKRHGRFVDASYGPKAQSVLRNLQRFNLALKTFGGDLSRLEAFLMKRFTMGEIRRVAEGFSINIGGAELNDEVVHGSMIFGPKIGNGFFQNLMGNHDPVTIDLWFMRMWGRYTGTLVKREIPKAALTKLTAGIRKSLRSEKMTKVLRDAGLALKPSEIRALDPEELANYTKKLNHLWSRRRRAELEKGRTNDQILEIKTALGWANPAKAVYESLVGTVDTPRNGNERRRMRAVTRQSVDILRLKGYSMSPADLQATLWYPEKELYGHLTGRDPGAMNVSYEQALVAAAKNEGYTDGEIDDAIEAGAGRSRRAGGDGCLERDAGRGGFQVSS
ncbi:hypothetical protein [Roseibium sp. RKSG952]|uniref:hypothetical protein n=1 Tax=Roseibium sp. RKSG952 TaxID=2529384 RepID=UPI0012BD7E07|nr:hypothetical protein [Roseibium sp. RKSG952]MTH95599.1 hypothetical protein [Roseibium sp. RKSG952]